MNTEGRKIARERNGTYERRVRTSLLAGMLRSKDLWGAWWQDERTNQQFRHIKTAGGVWNDLKEIQEIPNPSLPAYKPQAFPEAASRLELNF